MTESESRQRSAIKPTQRFTHEPMIEEIAIEAQRIVIRRGDEPERGLDRLQAEVELPEMAAMETRWGFAVNEQQLRF